VYGLGCLPSKRLVTGTFKVCCPLVPQPDTPILTGGVSVLPAYTVRSARIFVLDILKVLFPALPLSSTTLHVTYHEAGLTP